MAYFSLFITEPLCITSLHLWRVVTSKKKGFTEQNAVQIFEILIPFAGYGFNKSHAVAYTKMAFWEMNLKMHYNEEYETVMEDIRKTWKREEEVD